MINWWEFAAGLVGAVGVAINASANSLSWWLVGVAFLVMFVASFFAK